MATKPVQSAPNFNTGAVNLMLAHFHYVQAKQAQATHQWSQVCVLAQACIAAAQHDIKLGILAKELLAEGFSRTYQLEQALTILVELDQLKPNDAVVLSNIGLTLTSLHRYEDAISYLKRAVTLQPHYAVAHINLGLAFSKCGDNEQAKVCYLHASKLDPTLTQSRQNLAKILLDEGRADEAQQIFEAVLQLEPDNLNALGGIIFIQHARYPIDKEYQMNLLKRYSSIAEGESKFECQIKNRLLDSNQTLKVGFVSGDFRKHPVGFFLESTLAQIQTNHELCDRLQLVGYYNNYIQDPYTDRLRTKFNLWHQVDSWTDERLIEQIGRDNIDILIDLSGHTECHRLSIFAKKSAPLQISWLGYFGSTGLTSIDYVLADSISVPDDDERWFSEKIWRLPHLRYCFSIPDDFVEVSNPPCIYSPKLVFGCYQVTTKINNTVLKYWADILRACPQAHLRIQSLTFVHSELKDQFVKRLESANIDIQRVELIGKMSRQDYLASYAAVDMLLDTFPYPGGTTTAEALWMGVPTLTLALPSMLGRQGEALMVNAGLSDWVAYSEYEYVQKAIEWGNADAQKRQKLAKLRAGLREQVRQSPVFDAKQFASHFVDAMYGMWSDKYGS